MSDDPFDTRSPSGCLAVIAALTLFWALVAVLAVKAWA